MTRIKLKRPKKRLTLNHMDPKQAKTNQNRQKLTKWRPKLTQNNPKQAKTTINDTYKKNFVFGRNKLSKFCGILVVF